MKGAGFLVGLSLPAIVKILFKSIKIVVEVLASAIFYFGLYVPLLYLAYAGILYFCFKFNPFDLSANSLLYLFGFALCFIASIVISVKNLIVKPYNKHFKKKFTIEYPEDELKKLSKRAPEAPKIYKSKVNEGIIVYEYYNRYDLYEDTKDGLRLVDTEFKTRKERRW